MNRQAVVDAAIAELGPDTHEKRIKYWESALGYEIHHFEEISKLAWCGGFALYCLHTAGLALDKHWRIGAGFLLQQPHPLAVTRTPEPGDIGYQNSPFQHHFIVERVEGAAVLSIDGNQPDVRKKSRTITPALTFYSIAPLLPGAPETPRKRVDPIDVQRAVNTLILRSESAGKPKPLKPDGIIGPLSSAAIGWAQRELRIPVTGNPDAATCHALGLP